MATAAERFSLKDHLFNKERVEYFAGLIVGAYPGFDARGYVRDVVKKFPELELKARIEHMAVTLESYLPDDYPKCVHILVKALPPELDPSLTDDDFGDFILTPLSHYIVLSGCNKNHLALSLDALREMTKRFSVEHSIRYFLNDFPVETMKFLAGNVSHENYHVRRLVSEGTRPSLPWSQNIVIEYVEMIPFLDALCADTTRYVTRSVANHMNDISKLDPELVVQTLMRWKKEGRQNETEMSFVIKHSLRTLVKQGYAPALELLGYSTKSKVKVVKFKPQQKTVKIGESIVFNVGLESKTNQKLLIDYIVYFASPNTRESKKVFKIKTVAAKKSEVVEIEKKHFFRIMTTKKLYLGEHKFVLQINGQQLGEFSVVLVS